MIHLTVHHFQLGAGCLSHPTRSRNWSHLCPAGRRGSMVAPSTHEPGTDFTPGLTYLEEKMNLFLDVRIMEDFSSCRFCDEPYFQISTFVRVKLKPKPYGFSGDGDMGLEGMLEPST